MTSPEQGIDQETAQFTAGKSPDLSDIDKDRIPEYSLENQETNEKKEVKRTPEQEAIFQGKKLLKEAYKQDYAPDDKRSWSRKQEAIFDFIIDGSSKEKEYLPPAFKGTLAKGYSEFLQQEIFKMKQSFEKFKSVEAKRNNVPIEQTNTNLGDYRKYITEYAKNSGQKENTEQTPTDQTVLKQFALLSQKDSPQFDKLALYNTKNLQENSRNFIENYLDFVHERVENPVYENKEPASETEEEYEKRKEIPIGERLRETGIPLVKASLEKFRQQEQKRPDKMTDNEKIESIIDDSQNYDSEKVKAETGETYDFESFLGKELNEVTQAFDRWTVIADKRKGENVPYRTSIKDFRNYLLEEGSKADKEYYESSQEHGAGSEEAQKAKQRFDRIAKTTTLMQMATEVGPLIKSSPGFTGKADLNKNAHFLDPILEKKVTPTTDRIFSDKQIQKIRNRELKLTPDLIKE